MALPESYTLKPNAIPAYFDAILDAQPPERFTVKFLENLGFQSTNDRLFIGILKDLGFLNRDGAPQTRYFEFLDRSRSKHVVAEGIRDGFSDLFAINIRANELNTEDVKNKLRTMFAGRKTDLVISHIAKTFAALCEYADFTPAPPREAAEAAVEKTEPDPVTKQDDGSATGAGAGAKASPAHGRVNISALQYHINIVLPDTRDQAVYDAIFKSLREHLG